MKKLMACLLMLLPLWGCQVVPFARELESTMLVQVLGVDWDDGGVTLTAACDPSAIGGEGESVLAAWGEDMEQAQKALQGSGERYVSLTHVTQLILGAETEVIDVLKAALEEPALGHRATVWQAEKGTAQDLMSAVNGGAKRLSSIELNGNAEPVTVLQCLMHIEEERRVKIPLLAVRNETLEPAGSRWVEEMLNGA